MAHFGDGVEQALHYLFRLAGQRQARSPSARDVADFYRLSPSVAGKLFTRLEKAGIVAANEGRDGGLHLAKPLDQISVLDVTDAIEGPKPLFRCRDLRANCALFDDPPPDWATSGVCAIHSVMIDAERKMRDSLAKVTLQDIRDRASGTIPQDFFAQGTAWFTERRAQRRRLGSQTASQTSETEEMR